jgi:hypothetical protein
MTDGRSLDDSPGARLGRRALLAGLGAALGATAMLGAGALAQDAKPKEGASGDEKPPAQAPRAPTRRGISSPDRGGTRGGGRSFDGGSESVPGGLPGSAPTPWSDSKPGSAPGGLPGAR